MVYKKYYEIVDGVYHGPEVYKGGLDLRGTGVTSLGSLSKVVGWLDLDDTGVTDLGDLREVSRSLWLSGTGVTSLGKLREVGGILDLEGTGITSLGLLESVGTTLFIGVTNLSDLGVLGHVGHHIRTVEDSSSPAERSSYSLPVLKSILKHIESVSVSEIVEMLPEEEDPFLRRAMERRLRE